MATEIKTEARTYYEAQGRLAQALSDLNSGSMLDEETRMPWTRKAAVIQPSAIKQFIARREAEIEALKDALLDVELMNRTGKLEAFLEDRGN